MLAASTCAQVVVVVVIVVVMLGIVGFVGVVRVVMGAIGFAVGTAAGVGETLNNVDVVGIVTGKSRNAGAGSDGSELGVAVGTAAGYA